MPTATIQIAGKSDPEMGKKRGRIKGSDGMIFQASPEILAKVVVGTTYEVSYKDEEFKDFKYRVVEHVSPANGATTPQAQSFNVRGPSGQVMVPQTSSGDSFKDEQIASLAIIKTKSGEAGDRVASLHALKQAALAWRDFKKWQKEGNIETGKRRSSEEEFNDDIPY